jgi:MoaA/NifB/PqqE/SkfB family radical SAM enzyme
MNEEHSTIIKPPVKGLYLDHKRAAIDSFRDFAKGLAMPRWPVEVFLEISNVCDLKCAMCPTFSALNPNRLAALKTEERGFINAGAVQQSLHELLKYALNVHCFGYGEPTIHPDFRELVSWLAHYDVLIDFFTNGMHLDDDLSNFLVDNLVYKISVSFSGVTKNEYENVYIGGVFEQVLGGLQALARAKSKRGSRYPIIHINSLAWEHHVAKIDSFVQLMADHGANVVHLKTLLSYESIPQLRGHESIFRPWIEGPILERAREIARRTGLVFLADQYEANAALNEDDWNRRKGKTATNHGEGKPERLVTIGSFKDEAKKVQFMREAPSLSTEEENNQTYLSDDELRTRLRIDVPEDTRQEFYCFEPFKTLYVRKNGKVKPCCFFSNDAYPLGDIDVQNSQEVWHGTAYSLVRRSILNGEYPLAGCNNCLKDKIGPPNHFVHSLIRDYEFWCRDGLHQAFDPQMADQVALLGHNTDIATRFRSVSNVPSSTTLTTETKQSTSSLDTFEDIVKEVRAREAEGKWCSDLLTGFVDRVEATLAYGWAFSPSAPDARVEVEVLSDGEVISTAPADRFRRDLLDAGIHDGFHAFEASFPPQLSLEQLKALRIRISGTSFYLPMPIASPSSDPSELYLRWREDINDPCDHFISLIEAGTPFSFSKYGDGEYICIFEDWEKNGGANIDGDRYTPKLSKALKESLDYVASAPNSYLGEWPAFVDKWQSLTQAKVRWAPYEVFIINGMWNDKKVNIYRAIKASQKKKIVVCNELLLRSKSLLNADHIVVVPFNSWFDSSFDDVFEQISDLIGKDGNHMVLFCAGMSSKVLIAELMKRFPNGIYLDLGSALDLLCTQRKTRVARFDYPYMENLFRELLPDDWNDSKYEELMKRAQRRWRSI